MKKSTVKLVMNAIFCLRGSQMYNFEELQNKKALKQCEVYRIIKGEPQSNIIKFTIISLFSN